MVKIKYNLILFLVILAFSVFSLHGVEIKFYDCDGEELIPDKIEYAKKWKEAAENVINNQDVIDCLPRNWKNSAETWMKYSIVQIKICRNMLHGPNYCGNLIEEYIVVPEENNSGCGCEEATIFHEFIHQAVPVGENETNDRKIRGCEKLILTKFIKNCQDNPPANKFFVFNFIFLLKNMIRDVILIWWSIHNGFKFRLTLPFKIRPPISWYRKMSHCSDLFGCWNEANIYGRQSVRAKMSAIFLYNQWSNLLRINRKFVQ